MVYVFHTIFEKISHTNSQVQQNHWQVKVNRPVQLSDDRSSHPSQTSHGPRTPNTQYQRRYAVVVTDAKAYGRLFTEAISMATCTSPLYPREQTTKGTRHFGPLLRGTMRRATRFASSPICLRGRSALRWQQFFVRRLRYEASKTGKTVQHGGKKGVVVKA